MTSTYAACQSTEPLNRGVVTSTTIVNGNTSSISSSSMTQATNIIQTSSDSVHIVGFGTTPDGTFYGTTPGGMKIITVGVGLGFSCARVHSE